MKKYLLLVFTVFALLFQGALFANTVVVKGYVKDSANHAIANKTVRIYNADSVNQGCLLAHTVVTNPNGYYIDTLSCNADIRKLLIVVENCNGEHITHEGVLTSGSNTVESNFTICVAPVPSTTCKASFQNVLVPEGMKFTSNLSEAPTGDSILSRTWIFGDNTPTLTGNITTPVHVFANNGTYNVCLYIKTKSGCESHYCGPVAYKKADTCFAYVHVNVEPSSARKFRFTSNTASTASGDSIISRTWSFGDGTTLSGNEVYPIKEYKDTGVFNVCVYVKTKRGCEASHCFTIMVRDTTVKPTNCKAFFTATVKDSIVYFSSAASTAPDGDSIISRTWYYTGNTAGAITLGGNVTDTFYKYATPGTYQVYLVIKTKKGCESKYAGSVTIPARPTVCRLQVAVSFEKISAHKFRFSSSQSSAAGDSIISRRWKFSDGTSLDGNEISPLKEFKDTGVYNVCVNIKTKGGCEKEFCLTIEVRDSVVKPTNCKAYFTVTVKDSVVYFSSRNSSAPDGDSIISRTWYYNDNTLSTPLVLTGNVIDTFINYSKPGSYTVYLTIKTKNGCESKFEGHVVIPPRPATGCKALFSFSVQGLSARFNSAVATAPAGDSITNRYWVFGDSSQSVSGSIDPVHAYSKAGTYNAILYIKTKNGCESKYEASVVITPVPAPCNAKAAFVVARVSGKKMQFNSSLSSAQTGDSIVQRRWKFGDGTALEGNEISPVKEYNQLGIYNACLTVKTAFGCETQECKQVYVQDSLNLPETSTDYVKILLINPNPVATRMLATIWSRNNNTEVEISIIDIYGANKLGLKKVLSQGNNIVEINVPNLYHGPYFLKVVSKGGKDSKAFYKL